MNGISPARRTGRAPGRKGTYFKAARFEFRVSGLKSQVSGLKSQEETIVVHPENRIYDLGFNRLLFQHSFGVNDRWVVE